MGNGQKRNEPERGAVASEVMLAVPEGRALGGGRGEREKYTDREVSLAKSLTQVPPRGQHIS